MPHKEGLLGHFFHPDDGKNIMMTETPQTSEEKKRQERIWKEVINQTASKINNMLKMKEEKE